jgi:hypothetical protein
MTLQRTGEIHEFIIADQRELMGYLDVEGSEGRELLPLLKSKLGSALRSQVQSVRYRAPDLIVMVEKALEPAELRGENLGTMRPVCIRTMSLDESQLRVRGHFGLTEALINTCTEPDVAGELGLMWLADTETVSLLKEVESLKSELDSAREINTLLIDLAKTLAEDKGAQLQEHIIEKATSAMPHMTALNSNLMYDDLADLFRSSLGGSLEDDIRTEIIERINELHIVDRIALCLCEPDEVLENWVDNQYGEFPTPTSYIDIQLSCDTLIDQMTRAVERRIHEAIEA